jgi:polyisoprenoid-binding protein YceI
VRLEVRTHEPPADHKTAGSHRISATTDHLTRVDTNRVGAQERNPDSSISQPGGSDSLLLSAPAEWDIDPAASSVRFVARRFWGLQKLEGEFEEFAGGLVVDADCIDADLTIDTSTLRTGNASLDERLLSRHFFDIQAYPTIRFKLATVKPAETGWTVTGDLAVCDTSVHLKVPVIVHEETDRLTAIAQVRLPLSEAGLNWTRRDRVGSDVTVMVELSLDRTRPTVRNP